MHLDVPSMSPTSVYIPVGELQSPPTPSTDTSLSRRLRPAGMTGPGSYQITALALGPRVCEILYVSFKSEVSISPSLVGLLKLRPTGPQSQIL